MSKRHPGEPGFRTGPQDPSRVVTIPVRTGERMALMPDMHYPAQDKEAVDIFTRWLSHNRPDSIAGLGDTFDFLSLSSHRRSARQILDAGSIRQEALSAKADLAKFARYTKRRYIGPGNHEERIYAHIDDHPALCGIEWYDLVRDALDGWQTMPQRYVAKAGLATLCHGHTLKGSLNKYSAATVLTRNPGQSVFYGHTHRTDQTANATWRAGEPSEHMAATIGWLGDIDQVEYTEDDPWRLGFGELVFFALPDGRMGFTFHQHNILRTPAGLVLCDIKDGKVYK